MSYFVYIGKMFWPTNLALFYPFPQNPFPWWQVALAAILLLLVSGLAIFWRKTRPWFFAGWFWYLGVLVPVIGFVQVGMQSRADRYTYLPQIGLAIALIWGLAELTACWRYQRLIFGTSAAAVGVALLACTWLQLSYWRDSETLWNHTIAVTSNNDVAHAYLADLLLRQNRIEEAGTQTEEALRIRPDNSDAQIISRSRFSEVAGYSRQSNIGNGAWSSNPLTSTRNATLPGSWPLAPIRRCAMGRAPFN